MLAILECLFYLLFTFIASIATASFALIAFIRFPAIADVRADLVGTETTSRTNGQAYK